MARQNAPEKEKSGKKGKEKTPEPTDTKAPEETPEAPAESDDQTADESNGSKPDAKALLQAFSDAADKAVEDRDTETGGLTDEQLKPVVEAYQALPSVKWYNAARDYAIEKMTDAVMPPIEDNKLAKAWVAVKDALGPITTKKASKPVDPTEAFIQQRYSLDMGAALMDEAVPEGIAEDWEERYDKFVEDHTGEVESYQAWLASDPDERGDEPKLHPAVADAFKYAKQKVKKARKSGGRRTTADGTQRSTKTHIEQVFADKEIGTMLTIAQIAGEHSEEYGEDNPSQGAISQRVFPKGDKEADLPDGIIAVEAADGNPRSAKKVS